MMKEMVKEKAGKPKKVSKPWAWVKEANRARITKALNAGSHFRGGRPSSTEF